MLDMIRHSDRSFTIRLEGGESVRGISEGPLPGLATLWGKEVIVSGDAVFRPSGAVHHLEVDRIEPATGDISLWSSLPKPSAPALDRRSLYQGPTSAMGWNAISGQWPGDESDEELATLLEELS